MSGKDFTVIEDFEVGDRFYVVREWEVFLGTVFGMSAGIMTVTMDDGNREQFSTEEINYRPKGIQGFGKPIDLSLAKAGTVISKFSEPRVYATVINFIPGKELSFQIKGYNVIDGYNATKTIREMAHNQSIEQQMILWEVEG